MHFAYIYVMSSWPCANRLQNRLAVPTPPLNLQMALEWLANGSRMARESLCVDVLPDGLGGQIFAVACDDVDTPCFKYAAQAARIACDVPSGEVFSALECSLGSRAGACHPVVVAALREVDDGRHITRHHFDIVTLLAGPHSGKQAIAVGKSKKHRERASYVALFCGVLMEDTIMAATE